MWGLPMSRVVFMCSVKCARIILGCLHAELFNLSCLRVLIYQETCIFNEKSDALLVMCL